MVRRAMAERSDVSHRAPQPGQGLVQGDARPIVILLLLVSAALVLIVTIGGWDALEGAKPIADRLHRAST